MPPITFHLVPRAQWDATDPTLPYTPADFEREGFVHCTDGEVRSMRRAPNGRFEGP